MGNDFDDIEDECPWCGEPQPVCVMLDKEVLNVCKECSRVFKTNAVIILTHKKVYNPLKQKG